MLVNHFTECLIFGFPSNSKNAERINICAIYAKYYTYIHKIIMATINFDLFGLLSYSLKCFASRRNNWLYGIKRGKKCHVFEICIRKLACKRF